MANKIVFDYAAIDTAVATIRGLATKYSEAAQTFQTSMAAATNGWEGTSKDKFTEFVTGPIKTHMGTNVPQMVKGIATLLENNASSMKSADDQVGNKMPTTL